MSWRDARKQGGSAIRSLLRTVAPCGAVGFALTLTGEAAQEPPLALVGARAYPVASAAVERATLLIADGRIEAIGKEIAIPANARRVDARGKVVLPGLVDARSTLFLSQADLVGGGAADHSVLDAADFFSRDAEKVVARGVTTLFMTPGGRSGVCGLGAVVQLAPPGGDAPGLWGRVRTEQRALRAALGLSSGGRSTSLERLASYETLRSAFRGAAQYVNSFERYERELRAWERGQAGAVARPVGGGTAERADGQQGRPAAAQSGGTPAMTATKPVKPRKVPAQEVLAQALAGTLPVRIEAHRADDILNALRLADEFKLRLVLEGASDAAAVADEILRRGVAIVWGPTVLQEAPSLETRHHRPDTPARLAKAGVRVALTTGGETGLSSRFLLENAAAAVGHGLSPGDALRAITLTPVDILGLGDRLGSLERGKEADVVVLSGSPWSPKTRVEKVFVGGQLVHGRW